MYLGFSPLPNQANIELQMKDTVSGKTTVVMLAIHEAKALYLGLQEVFGDYQRPDPELFTTIPRLELDLNSFKAPVAHHEKI
jgi:hypothetical protein